MSMDTSDFGPRDYSDGRTKQSFKDSTDVNKIIRRAQKAGSLAHVQKYPEAVYGEFTGVDLLGAYQQVNRAQQIFDDLPSEVRREFRNDALAFAGFASDPANAGKLQELLPAIAAPGDYFPNPVQRGGQGAAAATAPQEPVQGQRASTASPPVDSPAEPVAPSGAS